jgi:hypothetical protein
MSPRTLVAALVLSWLAGPLSAEVTRWEIVAGPYADGKRLESEGRMAWTGKVHLLDPNAEANRQIVDLPSVAQWRQSRVLG